MTAPDTSPEAVEKLCAACLLTAEPPLSADYAGHDLREAVAMLRALSGELARAREWQPIETAPKDGTVILLYRYQLGSFSWIICYWNPLDGAWSVYESPDKWIYGATHWMPLPAAPSQGPSHD